MKKFLSLTAAVFAGLLANAYPANPARPWPRRRSENLKLGA
jgi:hypothetical protein